ncbi:MAG: FeoA family protein [Oscillospiraceae bacterium]
MKNDIISLSKLPLETEAYIYSLNVNSPARRRLLDLGFVKGNRVTPWLKSPAGDPTAYKIMGSVVALRNEDACMINVCHHAPCGR